MNYSSNIITNDNNGTHTSTYIIIDTIIEITNLDLQEFGNIGYTVQSNNSDKNIQRDNFYKKMLLNRDWEILDETTNHFKIRR